MRKEKVSDMVLNADGEYVLNSEASLAQRVKTAIIACGVVLAVDNILVPLANNGKSVHESLGIDGRWDIVAYGIPIAAYALLLYQNLRETKQKYFG